METKARPSGLKSEPRSFDLQKKKFCEELFVLTLWAVSCGRSLFSGPLQGPPESCVSHH